MAGMSMDLTVVLTNYMRPANMARILDALAKQIVPHQVFVWDNSPETRFQLDARIGLFVHRETQSAQRAGG